MAYDLRLLVSDRAAYSGRHHDVIVFGERPLRHVLRVPAVLQRHPDTSGVGQRLTANEVCPDDRSHSAAADPRRITPSLRPDLICDKDRAGAGEKSSST